MRYDRLYDLITQYQLPLDRGSLSVPKYLQQHFEAYIRDLSEYSNYMYQESEVIPKAYYKKIRRKIGIVKDLCNNINTFFEYYYSKKPDEVYKHFSKLMKEIQCYLPKRKITSCDSYYRIRRGDREYNREELFHIPFNSRQYISSYRYSIPGHPSLYLANGLEICWFECGMPSVFSAAEFVIADTTTEITLIDFAKRPTQFVQDLENCFIKGLDKSEVCDKLVNYLITYPLRAACSIIAHDKEKPFIEEYVFPQYLLLWVKYSSEFEGISYRSCSSEPHAQNWNYYNIVLPTIGSTSKYCERLTGILAITKPVQMTTSSVVKAKEAQIREIEDFLKKLDGNPIYSFHSSIEKNISYLCHTFLSMCRMLKTGDYKNPSAIYQTMNTLVLFADLINNNKEAYSKQFCMEAKDSPHKIERTKAEEQYDKMMDRFKEITNIIDDFWNYIFKMEHSFNTDEYMHLTIDGEVIPSNEHT